MDEICWLPSLKHERYGPGPRHPEAIIAGVAQTETWVYLFIYFCYYYHFYLSLFYPLLDIQVISKWGQMEYKHGFPERGRTIFEGIVANYPKRLDIWSVYLDMELKTGDISAIRYDIPLSLSLSCSCLTYFCFFQGNCLKWLRPSICHRRRWSSSWSDTWPLKKNMVTKPPERTWSRRRKSTWRPRQENHK